MPNEVKIKTPVTDTGVDDKTTDTTSKQEEPKVGEPTGPVGNTGEADDTSDKDTSETKEVVVIDSNEYTLNESGDAVDKDGNVFKTKSELEELSEEDDKSEPDDSKSPSGEERDVSISDIEKMSGIEVYKEGKKVEYDVSLEGLAKREQDIKTLGLKEGEQSAIKQFFNSNPDLYKAYLYKSKKGSLDGFSNEPFYQSVELDTENEEQLFNFIVDAEVKKGSDPERAKSIAKFFKAENKLEDEGKAAYEYLTNQEKTEIDSFAKQEENQKKEQIKKETEFFGTYFDESGKEVIVNNEGSVYNKIVEKGSFGNFVIPEGGLKVKKGDGTEQTLSRKEIYDYTSKPVTKEGYTQAQIDEMKRMGNTDALLYQYILNLTGNDVSQLIERKILEEKGKMIKKRLVTKPTTSKSHSKPDKDNKKLKLPVG